MAGSGQSRANANRAIRQEALREQLSAQGHVQHVIDIAEKLSDLEGEKDSKNKDLDALHIQRLRAAADIKKGLINKYLPDLKSTEVTGDFNIGVRDLTGLSNEELEQIANGEFDA